MLIRKWAGTFLLLTAGMLTGCTDNPASPDGDFGTLKVSLKISNSGAGTAARLQRGVAAVTITKAHVVITKIEVESSDEDSLDIEFREPFIQNLAADTGFTVIETVEVPFGSYDEFEIKIHRLRERYGPVFDSNPDLQNRSIYVEGFVDGDSARAFSFASDIALEQEQELETPIVFDENSPAANIVLALDTSVWFVGEGGAVLDPSRAENRKQIEKNIRRSLRFFEDEDDDGEEDDDDDDD